MWDYVSYIHDDWMQNRALAHTAQSKWRDVSYLYVLNPTVDPDQQTVGLQMATHPSIQTLAQKYSITNNGLWTTQWFIENMPFLKYIFLYLTFYLTSQVCDSCWQMFKCPINSLCSFLTLIYWFYSPGFTVINITTDCYSIHFGQTDAVFIFQWCSHSLIGPSCFSLLLSHQISITQINLLNSAWDAQSNTVNVNLKKKTSLWLLAARNSKEQETKDHCIFTLNTEV